MNILTKPGIYKITNIVNGKVYIGSSIKIINRKRDHFKRLRNGYHKSRNLQSAFDNYR